MKTLLKYALVTGAGMGLGKAMAIHLASLGHNLLLIARHGEGLVQLCDKLSRLYEIKVHCMEADFTNEKTFGRLEQWLKSYSVNILVNNAGIGGSNYFLDAKIESIDAIIKVNIRATVLLTRLLIENLHKNTPAYILNIASMASCCPIAFKTVYPASKSFIYSFSRGLHQELKSLNIHISVLMPGPIKTNMEISSRIDKQGWWVKAGLQKPHEIAEIAIKKMFKQQSVIIPGYINKINWLLLKLLPKNVSIPMVSNAIKNELPEVAAKLNAHALAN
ncbi:SDR family NAD(P)-dependent oxidoreductase [Carboxylicivirga sp. RSCT41]|uniref:SDR family NAD(P)-dependent oxidoreductase n=1 Tax=Carboxylicivirga agarovorans TaxID=3417570 RepID=UPI003D3475E4